MKDTGRNDFFVFGGNATPSEVHDTDHGKPWSHSNPHAHDIGGGKYGKPRELNSDERYAKESFDTEDNYGNKY